MKSLSNVDRNNFIDFLVKHSDYARSFYEKMKDNQLFAVYMSFREKRSDLINKLLSVNPKTGCLYTSYGRDYLYGLKIRELKKLYDDACNSLIIIDEPDDDREFAFLTPDELSMMYGCSVMDLDSKVLENDGYKVIEETNMCIIAEVQDELRNKITTLIVAGEFKDYYGKKYTNDRLSKLSLDELCFVYNYLTGRLDDYETAEEIEFGLRLMKD